MNEIERIRQEYQRRAREIPPSLYAPSNPPHLFLLQQRTRHLLAILRKIRLLPLHGKRILEVGCGAGGWLPTMEEWGAERGDLAGIDLDADRIAQAERWLSGYRDQHGQLLSPGADLRHGDAAALPWEDESFDLVIQSTVMTSILDPEMKRAVAAEMLRVLRGEGYIIWYDFCYHNPRNRQVRGIGKREIQSLFPACHIWLKRITLAPPLARRIVPWSWTGAFLLENLRFLNTHYLGVIQCPRSVPR